MDLSKRFKIPYAGPILYPIRRKRLWTIFLSISFVVVILNAALLVIFNGELLRGNSEGQVLHMATRMKVLYQRCIGIKQDDVKENRKSLFKNIIVNDKYKIMFCYVPKVACTNFLRLLIWLNNTNNVFNTELIKTPNVHILKKSLPSLGMFEPQEIKHRLKHYRKVIFVRDPLVRLISAFRNKFIETKNTYFMSRYGKAIIQRAKNGSLKDIPEIGTITFSEFLIYLADKTTIRQGYEDHWKPFKDICHPCYIKYDFIGKYESIEEDVGYLLKMLNVQNRFKFPEREKHYNHTESAHMISSFFKDVDPDIFSKLIKVYADDYALFNYSIPSFSVITST
ncbi:carbohydrate sulfotransferase 11-like [Ruditapes philippinarum]|uniref:carbohydrate sulfotransferase 11-like n=1 Tax=Ruditapes philippinarum TaxID=129788 RepID=UPI00295AD9E5|nr:carbohydrate sulfotransferase 11-like [Ruditapes philippinarum]